MNEKALKKQVVAIILSKGLHQLINIDWLKEVLDDFSAVSGLNATMYSLPSYKTVIKSGKLDICKALLLAQPELKDKCKANKTLTSCQLNASNTNQIIAPCLQGFMDGSAAVIVHGHHIADIHVGPFLFPDYNHKQLCNNAEKLHIPSELFSEQIKTVPILTVEKAKAALSLLSSIAAMIARKTMDNLIIEHRAEQHEQEEKTRKAIQRQLAESLSQIETIFANSQVGIALLGKDRTLIRCNQRMADIMGYQSPEELIGMSMKHMHLSEERYKKFGELYYDTLVAGEQIQIEYEIKRRDGTPVWCMFSGKAMDSAVPPDLNKGVLWVADDITEKKHTQIQLTESLAQLEVIFNNSQVGIMHLKGGRYLQRGNQRLADILGYASPEEMIGLSMRNLHLSPKKYHDYGKRFYETLIKGKNIHVEYELSRKDGTPVWCSLSGKALDTDSPPNLDKGVLWIIDDISDRKRLEEQLIELASVDALTGALNRRVFQEQVSRELAIHSRYDRHFSLLMIDIDHFKSINDSYGHATGDNVLCHIVKMIHGLLRESDIFGRLGGEEFAVAMPDCDKEDAIKTAERIRQAIAKSPIKTSEQNTCVVTISIGVASCPPFSDLTKLLKHADQALYKAKQGGRNKVNG